MDLSQNLPVDHAKAPATAFPHLQGFVKLQLVVCSVVPLRSRTSASEPVCLCLVLRNLISDLKPSLRLQGEVLLPTWGAVVQSNSGSLTPFLLIFAKAGEGWTIISVTKDIESLSQEHSDELRDTFYFLPRQQAFASCYLCPVRVQGLLSKYFSLIIAEVLPYTWQMGLIRWQQPPWHIAVSPISR